MQALAPNAAWSLQTGERGLASIAGEINRVSVSNFVIRLGDVLEIIVTEAALGDDPNTAPVEVFVAIDSTVRRLRPKTSGTKETLTCAVALNGAGSPVSIAGNRCSAPK